MPDDTLTSPYPNLLHVAGGFEPERSPADAPATDEEVRVPTVLPPRYPPVTPLLTPDMQALSAAVRTRPELRHELISQAQETLDISAFERVLATAYGASRGLGLDLGTPELLHWADRALGFRQQAYVNRVWEATAYTQLNTRHPVWDDPALQNGAYPRNDPLWGHVAAGYLLALGFPRSPRTEREIRLARARHLEEEGAAFLRLAPRRRHHQSRLLPGLSPEQTVLGYRTCHPHRLEPGTDHPVPAESPADFTPVLVRFHQDGTAGEQRGLFLWPVSGPAVPASWPWTAEDQILDDQRTFEVPGQPGLFLTRAALQSLEQTGGPGQPEAGPDQADKPEANEAGPS